MSIIPYAGNREIVLRHNNAVVVFDPQSKQLALREVARADGSHACCPYCHRPLQCDDGSQPAQETSVSSSGTATSFVNGFISPEYFRRLHASHDDSQPGTDTEDLSGTTSTASRRLVQTCDPRPRSSSIPAPTSTPGISAAAFSPGYFARFFVEEKELGRGGKGVVLLVKHLLDGVTLGYFACKRVPVGDDHEWLERVLAEVQLLQFLSHQHLVSYRHVWLEEVRISTFGPSVPCAFILQQYCNAGDLHKFMFDMSDQEDDQLHALSSVRLKARMRRQSRHHHERPDDVQSRKLPFEQIYSFFKDIASGLNHLHVNGYIHRDLKPSNCLLHDSGGVLRVLVSDFGEVQLESMVRKSTGYTGTISYCAPEALRRNSSGTLGNFSTKSDIFSLGMILYFLCFSRLPYRHADQLNEENEDLERLKDEITSWSGLYEERKLRPELPERLYTFLRRLLSLDPTDRPSAEEILHGIKTGTGLDEISDDGPPSAGHSFDDLRNTSRISPIDSPCGGTPRPQAGARRTSTATGYARPSRATHLRLSSFQKTKNNIKSPYAEEGPTGPVSPTSPNDSLILREPYSSPTKVRRGVAEVAESRWPRQVMGIDLTHFSMQRSLRVVFLLLKIVSINLVCTPMAAEPWVAYPLLALTAFDVAYIRLSIYVSVLLLFAHVILLSVLSTRNVLCVSAAEL
ncbi:MAG: hypothetical protein Q9174_000355 [Haloplaca sp. 1 TL-2023]